MLSKAKIQKLSKAGLYGDEKTLYLRVATGGSKSWVQRVLIDKVRRDLGLGSWPTVTVEQARKKAVANRTTIYNGEGHTLLKRKATEEGRGIPTFREATKAVISLNAPVWKGGGKTRQSWEQTLESYAFPSLGDVRVDLITAKDIHAVVAPLWTSKHYQGLKVRQRVGAVLQWCMVQGHRMDNPTEALSAVLPKADGLKKNFRSIPHGEVAEALQTVEKSGCYRVTYLCLKFNVLTGTRPSETRLAEWKEIDLDEKVWTIPASRTKTNKAFRVPLSSEALKLLEEVRRYKEPNLDLVFPSPRGGALSDNAVSKLFRVNGIQGVPHAVARSCFRSWCADVNVERELAEACLGHTVKGVEASYQRSDMIKRRANVMQKWSDYLCGTTGAKVLSFPVRS